MSLMKGTYMLLLNKEFLPFFNNKEKLSEHLSYLLLKC
jgi:hypothetical protein